MTPAQSAAYVQAMTACALIELTAMVEANRVARERGQPVPYTDRDMTELIAQHGISHQSVMEEFRQSTS